MDAPPRITLVVLAYRQAEFIDAACASALAQDCEPIEILLSDDASPDTTFERMQDMAASYRGPHQVRARRNPCNLGMGEHFNVAVDAARGRLLVLMAGDDIALPDRVRQVAAAWDAHGGAPDLVASHVIDMSHDGQDLGVLKVDDLSRWRSVEDWAHARPYIIGAAHAVSRRLGERFGPLSPTLAHEDQANVLRALCAGGAITVDAALLRYRRGGISARARHADARQLLATLQKQTVRHLALHEQWLLDARTAGCEARVAAATRREHARERFVLDVLTSAGLVARWRALRSHPEVALAWRLGKWLRIGRLSWRARLQGRSRPGGQGPVA